MLTFSVAKDLVRRGHDVFVFTGFPAQKHLPDVARFDEYDLEGIPVFRFHHAFVPMGGQKEVTELEYNNLLAASYFARILERVAPDIVHFFHFSRLGASLIDVTVRAKVPAFYTPTDFWAVCPTSQLLLADGQICRGPSAHAGNCLKHVAALTRSLHVARMAHLVPDFVADIVVNLTANGLIPRYRLSQEVVALGRRRGFNVARLNALHQIVSPSRIMTEVLVNNGVDASLISQLTYGIDVTTNDKPSRTRGTSRTITFGFIGTLAPHKGCHVLINAIKQLNSDTVRLRIYGNTQQFPEYVTNLKHQTNGLPFIQFCGTFPIENVAEVMAEIDALIVPSLWPENTPLVLYSALASKCPVVASDFPGISEVIRDGWNGLLFTPGNEQSLRSKLTRLCEDAGLLARLSANCERPKSTRKYVEELLSLYDRTSKNVRLRHEIAGYQEIKPSDFVERSGYISGWAVAGYATPLRVNVLLDGVVVGQSCQFLPRPDVCDGLRKNGAAVSGPNFGFVITFPANTDRAHAVLRLEAKTGHVVEVPIAHIARGSSVQLSPGHYVGIDDENFWSVN